MGREPAILYERIWIYTALLEEKFKEIRSEQKLKAAKLTKKKKSEEQALWRAPPEKMRETT